MSQDEIIVGIDLGTTNSEVAAFINGKVQLLGPEDSKMLPSSVGLSPSGELLVGVPAQNQFLIYPERTARSIKREMGQDTKVTFGDQEFTPPEISALILKELASWAERALGQPIKKAVITVPAYFSDAQRSATREAGALAGLEVVRILNEPTAASLSYGYRDQTPRTVMVYDLGGGTFDVSVVTIEGDVTEVLASHGNNQLGGDDFDKLLVEMLLDAFRDEHGIDLRDAHPAAYSRVWWAAEEAKKKLSEERYVTVREEALATVEGKPLHLEVEISRDEYEEMIRPLVESTLDSVTKALDDAGKATGDLDGILLVGGSTRTPLVSATLEEMSGVPTRQEVHPDLCVALGAGVLASRLAGEEVDRVLVDVSPYSFGPSFAGELNGRPYLHCYRPIIRRNTPLPVTRAESYSTMHPYQREVEIEIYQGDDPDALKNILVGEFNVKGLKAVPDCSEVLCRMSLDLDGILHVTAIEKITGKSKHITIDNVTRPLSDREISDARERLHALHSARATEPDDAEPSLAEDGDLEGPTVLTRGHLVDVEELHRQDASTDEESADQVSANEESRDEEATEEESKWKEVRREADALMQRSRNLLGEMHDEDQEEAIDLHERIQTAIDGHDAGALSEAAEELKELLFFVEDK